VTLLASVPSASAVQVDVFGWTLGTMSVRGLLALVAVFALVTGAAAATALSLLVAWQRDRTRVRLALAEDDRRVDEARVAQREYLARRGSVSVEMNGHDRAAVAVEDPPTPGNVAIAADEQPSTDERSGADVRDQVPQWSDSSQSGSADAVPLTVPVRNGAAQTPVPSEPVAAEPMRPSSPVRSEPARQSEQRDAAAVSEANTLLVVDDEDDDVALEEAPAASPSDPLVLLPEPPDESRS
jgi:hypothetical protein